MRRHVVIAKYVLIVLVLPVALSVPGCPMIAAPGDFVGGAPPITTGEFGATQGGVQDLGLARELIAAGRVPPAEAFVVEGMFSEHELGLSGDPCDTLLCLRTAIGVAPTLDGETCGWLQVGLSSSIDMETYERGSLTLIATVDVSGSMGWEYATGQTEYVTPGEVSRNILSAVASELEAADQMAIVTYGSTVNTLLPLTGGDQQVTLQNSIDALSTGGSTNMEGGLVRAYEIARTALGETDEVRVMLFTDVQPNVGATMPSEFEQLVGAGAEDGIGITVLGVGVGLRQELLNAISHLHGGNAFTLFENEDVAELMEDSWPWMVSPIAYDLSVEVTPSPGYATAETYGFPSTEEEVSASLDVATVFLSRRKGALLVRFEPEADGDLVGLTLTGRLAYLTPEGQPMEQTIGSAFGGLPIDETGCYYEQPSVGRTIALAVLVSGMAEAAEIYGTSQDDAIAKMHAVMARYTADAGDDEELTPEIDLAAEMLRLMQEGAEQGDMYDLGQY